MKDRATYEGNISDTGWLKNELRHVDFKDQRLVDRLIKTANFLDSKASGTISQSCRSWKDAKGVMLYSRCKRRGAKKEKSRRRYITPIKDKESYKWITALKETVDNVPQSARIITIGDREADIFKFLWKIEESGTEFVIRNRQDRKFICFETGKTKMQTRISELQTKGVFRFKIPGNGNQKARQANVEVKYI